MEGYYKRVIGLILGPLLFVFLILAPPLRDPITGELMNQIAPWAPGAALGLMLWTVIWWLTEAIPLGLTSLLTAIIACALVGYEYRAFGYAEASLGVSDIVRTFFDKTIWVFFGGFVLGWGMQQSGFARRVSRKIALFFARISSNAYWAIAGTWITVWFLSMWMSNTSATAVAFSILLGILATSPWINEKQAEIAMIFLAFSASLGGIATIIGTPPNLIATAFLAERGIADIGFVDWLRYGMPVSVITFIILLGLGRVFFGKSTVDVQSLRASLVRGESKMSIEEKWYIVVFTITASLWVLRGIAKILGWSIVTKILPHDAIPAMICAVLLFSVPKSLKPYKPLFDWREGLRGIDWDTLFLFAGGLVMGNMLFKSGAGLWLGKNVVSISGTRIEGIILGGGLLTWILTQFASNTAATNMMAPILISLCEVAGFAKAIVINVVVFAAISASLAFLLPVSTPPNAVVFASGKVRIHRMLLYGLIVSAIMLPATFMLLWIILSL